MLYYDLTLYSFHHSVIYIFYHPKWYFHTIFPLRNLPPHNLYHLVILVISLSVLLLLCRFSHVWLPATPLTAAHQAPPFMGFSRQEHWSVLLQCMKVKSESEVSQSCLTLSDSMDCSLPGSSFHGIFQARVLE